ncbi:hypothetical protein ACS0TY_016605 [Phlomoides rotata]
MGKFHPFTLAIIVGSFQSSEASNRFFYHSALRGFPTYRSANLISLLMGCNWIPFLEHIHIIEQQLSIAGIQFAGMYSLMPSGNKYALKAGQTGALKM